MIILDTNILISALIRGSVTRRIIIESGFDFAYPEISMQELLRHKKYILEKSGYIEKEFEAIISKILEYINLVPMDIINPNLQEAKAIMKEIDVDDAVFLAAAIALDKAMIWSEDKDFERQHKVKTVKAADMIKFFERSKT